MGEQKKVSGWRGPAGSINTKGRPKKSEQDEKERKTNRQLRQDALLSLVRKFSGIQTKAIQAAVKVLDNENSNDASKLRAAALIIETHRALLKDLYDYRYDDEPADAISEDPPAPVFSLRLVEENEE